MARPIALYLPQYHPIEENNRWWGEGFTEWTNTGKARPMFRGHYQPHVPSDLGYYDLRVPEVRNKQAELANAYGVEAFCYYRYWFAGKELLERPFNEVVESGNPDFPFCVCWANLTWSGIWYGAPNKILIKQTYPGKDDHRKHFDSLLPAFLDKRYLKVDNKPLFAIYRYQNLPDYRKTLDFWREMAYKAGLDGLHIIGFTSDVDLKPKSEGLDGVVLNLLGPSLKFPKWSTPVKRLILALQRRVGIPARFDYQSLLPDLLPEKLASDDVYPLVTHSWDNTPRSGVMGRVITGARPKLFKDHLRQAVDLMESRDDGKKIVFLKSWNEWAEGNHLEPDLKDGHAYLQVIKEIVERAK